MKRKDEHVEEKVSTEVVERFEALEDAIGLLYNECIKLKIFVEPVTRKAVSDSFKALPQSDPKRAKTSIGARLMEDENQIRQIHDIINSIEDRLEI